MPAARSPLSPDRKNVEEVWERRDRIARAEAQRLGLSVPEPIDPDAHAFDVEFSDDEALDGYDEDLYGDPYDEAPVETPTPTPAPTATPTLVKALLRKELWLVEGRPMLKDFILSPVDSTLPRATKAPDDPRHLKPSPTPYETPQSDDLIAQRCAMPVLRAFAPYPSLRLAQEEGSAW